MVSSEILQVFLCFAVFNSAISCKFDEIVHDPVNVPKLSVNYRNREKRDDSDNSYIPIRIHVEADLSNVPKEIDKVLERAISKVSELLHVIPVNEPILLERTSCSSVWSKGPNKGRCSSLRARPQEELCENKIDGFQIPESHLQKLDVYSYSEIDPIATLRAGTGVKNADYVLYVKSKYTPMCEQGDVQAYASYCRLDQFNRPIAGFINFCPSPSRKKAFDVNYFVNIAIHELFHALGFSKDLFPHFKGCSVGKNGSTECYETKHIITSFGGFPRLMFPSVAKEMQLHFDCIDDKFGAPLEYVNGSVTSHWDPLFLHGSIMSPSLDEPEYVFIDQITLAALADSGWYKVNYQFADQYLWGLGEGCEFGLRPECYSKANILCKAKEATPGCDMMQYTQTSCQKVSLSHTCGVYKPDSKNDCRNKLVEVKGQHLHHLRCFMLESQGEVHTTCAAYHCTSTNELMVLVQGIDDWVSCSKPPNKSVNLYGTILHCPRSDVVCLGKDHKLENHVHHPLNGSASIWIFPFIGIFSATFSVVAYFYQKIVFSREYVPSSLTKSK